jgi:hypothetical protein
MSASEQVELVLMRRLKECGGGATLDMLTREVLVSETLSTRELVQRGLAARPDTIEEPEPQLIFSVSVFRQWIGRMLDSMTDTMTMDDAAQALAALVVQKPPAAPWPGVFPPLAS